MDKQTVHKHHTCCSCHAAHAYLIAAWPLVFVAMHLFISERASCNPVLVSIRASLPRAPVLFPQVSARRPYVLPLHI